MNLVDEQDIARTQTRERADQIARLRQGRAARDHGTRAHLGGDHMRQRGLAESGRAVQQHMIDRLAAMLRRLHRDANPLDQVRLPHVLVQPPRPKRRPAAGGLLVLDPGFRRDQPLTGHRQNATFGAARTASSSSFRKGSDRNPKIPAIRLFGNTLSVSL